MESIYEFLSGAGMYKAPRHLGDVGIEIETEADREYKIPDMGYWRAERDGSLRDFGIEYILKGPVNVNKELDQALSEFTKKMAGIKLNEQSISTSVHVHLNFLNNKWIHVVNFMTVYYLLENLLIKASGPDRLSNLFCLPICDAEGCVDSAKDLIRGISKHSRRPVMNPDGVKYAALNLANLYKIGTLEVRSMRGTTNPEIISMWAKILHRMKEFASLPEMMPLDILEIYRRTGVEFLHEVFPDRAMRDFLNIPNKEELIKSNLWYARIVASSCPAKDSMWGFPKPKRVVRQKLIEELNRVANEMYGAPFADLPFEPKMAVEEIVAINLEVDHKVFFNFIEGDE